MSSRVLRVALDATPLIGRPTGVGVFCSGLLGGLAVRDDVSVDAFAVSWRRRQAIAGAVPSGVRVRQRPMPARPLHALWSQTALPPIEWFIGRTDVVHGTNFVVPPTRRARRVVTVHDLTPVRFPDFANRATLVYPDLIRRALRGGAWVHTPSQFVAHEVIECFGADPSRVRAVHSGTPLLGPVAQRDEAAQLLRGAPWWPTDCARYVLSVGTAEPRKDLPGLVRAFGQMAPDRPDVALLLVGPDGWGTHDLERAIAASPVRTRIVRTGWCDDATLAAAFAGASVLAYPSVYEGFGFPPLQAMSVGTPVVASRAGALPEILGDAATLVDVGDHDALARSLADVLDHPEVAATLIERGRRSRGDVHLAGLRARDERPVSRARRGRVEPMSTSEPERQRVLLVVDQLRRLVPGGIGTYAQGLLSGLLDVDASGATPGAGVDLELLASHPSRQLLAEHGTDPLADLALPMHVPPIGTRLLTRGWDIGMFPVPRRGRRGARRLACLPPGARAARRQPAGGGQRA